MKKTTNIKFQLEEEDIKQAVVEYMDKHHEQDFVLEEISFKAENDGQPRFRCYLETTGSVEV